MFMNDTQADADAVSAQKLNISGAFMCG